MNNRFFDINSNIYLNSIYMLAVIEKVNKPLEIDEIIRAVYLIKNPYICLSLLNKKSQNRFRKGIPTYEINNVQSDMAKYNAKISIEGINEVLVYLISKDIISYDLVSEKIIKSEEYSNINLKQIPKEILFKAKFVVEVMENYTQQEIEEKIINYKGDSIK